MAEEDLSSKAVLKVHEAAKILRLATRTVYGLAAASKIPNLRIGHRVLIPREGLLRFIASIGNDFTPSPNPGDRAA